jgi:hypothetical protein
VHACRLPAAPAVTCNARWLDASACRQKRTGEALFEKLSVPTDDFPIDMSVRAHHKPPLLLGIDIRGVLFLATFSSLTERMTGGCRRSVRRNTTRRLEDARRMTLRLRCLALSAMTRLLQTPIAD